MSNGIAHITTKEMAEEVAEEVRRRQRTYPLLVAQGKMTHEQADNGLAAMKAAQFKLERLVHKEQGQTELF